MIGIDQILSPILRGDMVYLFVPCIPVGVTVTAEAGQQLFLHLSRMELRQTAQVEIWTQTGRVGGFKGGVGKKRF